METLKVYSSILIIFTFSSIAFADEVTDKLDSPDYYVRYMTVGEIFENQWVQYIPALAERGLDQPMLYLSYRFLEGLYKLGYDDVKKYAHNFINICDSFPGENPLYYKSRATSILVDLSEFSTIHYAFEFIEADPLNNAERIMPLLYSIGSKVPEYSDTVKTLLIMVKNNSDISISRREAFNDLLKLYGENNLQSEILASVKDDEDPSIRHEAMAHYYFSDRKDVLKQQIRNESERILREEYAEIFLKESDNPEDLKFLIDYNMTEPDTSTREYIKNVILGFAPRRPDKALSVLDMTNNLISLTDELYDYQWIRNESTYHNYKKGLNIIAEDIRRGVVKDASAGLSDMIDQVESDYNNASSITFYAWEFLHYHLQYIHDKLQ